MNSMAAAIVDTYERKARLQPALLAILPVLVAVVVVGSFDQSYAHAILGLLLYGGTSMLLVQVGRDRGKQLEPELFRQWGGKPSVALLRHRDTQLTEPTKKRYHAFLSRAVPELCLPTADQEASSPEVADEQYEAANAWLISQTRDQQVYRLLFRDNVTYGFRRNLLALRPIGISIDAVILAFLGLIYSLKLSGFPLDQALEISGKSIAVIVLACLVHLTAFCLVVTRNWVRIAAEAYAERLLESCDRL